MYRFTIAVGLSVFLVGCNSATSPSAAVSSISVTGVAPTVGSTSQFKATALMSDGTTQDVTNLAAWQSSNAADATVSTTGLVTGVADGFENISATYQNVTGSEAISSASIGVTD
jgi:uncharacterized protein YjdB